MNSEKIEVVPTSEGVRIELPIRSMGPFKTVGWILLAFSCFATLVLLLWSAIWFWIGIVLVVDEGFVWGWAIAAIGLLGLLAMTQSLKFAALGWYLATDRTRCHVEINQRFLISNERLGMFNWRRKVALERIKRIAIEYDEENFTQTRLMTIRAYLDLFKSFLVAPGYPETILRQTASELGPAINRQRGADHQVEINMEPVATRPEDVHDHDPDEDELAHVDLGTRKTIEAENEKLAVQPADSKIQLYDHAGTEAFQVPPMGIRKGSKGLLGFSLFWNGFMIVFTTIAVTIAIVDGMDKDLGWLGLILGGCFFALFWSIGIGTLIAAINAGRRSAMLGVAGGMLFVERKSLFGTSWIEIPVDEVKSIKVGPSGTAINNIPILELHIRQTDGKQHKLLSQLSNDDLYWIAQELRQSISESASAAEQ